MSYVYDIYLYVFYYCHLFENHILCMNNVYAKLHGMYSRIFYMLYMSW